MSDRGDSIAIAITRDGKTSVRVYRDAARDCARRAHFVSVLVVISLMPPDLGSDPEPEAPAPSPPETPPAPTAPPAEPPPKNVRAPRHVRVELAAHADVSTAISDSAKVALVGGALGVALGAGQLRFTLGAAYAPRTELRYTGDFVGRAALERFDLAGGARLALSHAPVDTSLDLGLIVTRAVVSGQSSQRNSQATALSLGGRLGLHACWSEQSVVSPFLGAYASVFPFAPALSQLPQGTVGHLPYLWVGLAGGLALAL